ncbi:MAG: GNAT family N-acetyltransferase [Bacilli bacterium]|nr:GNAT family N-acetyltransferase [Bacilli bacterium]
MLEFKENIDNVEEFNYLYDAVGWGSYDKEISSKALKNNIYSVSLYDNNQIVGYGRIIGDGYIFLYIQDIMVSPEHQGKHIGTEIMNKLLDKIEEIKKENPDILVYLGASLGKEKFYEKFGFIKREDYGLGPGMILKG